MTAPYFISHWQQRNDSADSAPDTSDPQHGPIRVRPARSSSGRPGGKCKCCGKLGSYTKTCGLKHTCEIGKCAIKILQTYDAPPPPEKNTFEVACVLCQKPLRFTVQGAGSAEIVCYGCGFTMRSMAKEVAGEDSGSESEAGEEVSDAESTDTVPATVYVEQGEKASTQCVRCQSRLEFEPTAHCSILQCCECDCKMMYQPHSSAGASRLMGGNKSAKVAVEDASEGV